MTAHPAAVAAEREESRPTRKPGRPWDLGKSYRKATRELQRTAKFGRPSRAKGKKRRQRGKR